MDNQIYMSQLSTSLFFYKLLFEVKKINMRLNKTVKLKFRLTFFGSTYLTPFTPYLIGGKTIQMVFGLILLL